MLLKCRPSDVAAWPAWEVRMLEEYLSVQPAPEERIEIALAKLHATHLGAYLKAGAPTVKFGDLLPYINPWKARQREKRYSDVDRDLLSVLGD